MLFFVFIIELGQISDIYEDVGPHAFCLKRVQRYFKKSETPNKLGAFLDRILINIKVFGH